jgi:hypothetical protein
MAKAWLARRLPNGYSETVDQPALSEAIDVARVRKAASFDKLVRDLGRLLQRP